MSTFSQKCDYSKKWPIQAVCKMPLGSLSIYSFALLVFFSLFYSVKTILIISETFLNC